MQGTLPMSCHHTDHTPCIDLTSQLALLDVVLIMLLYISHDSVVIEGVDQEV